MSHRVRRLRNAALVAGVVAWVVFLAPPLDSWAGRYEFMNALQFGVFAFWVPAALAVGAPWRLTRAGRALAAGDTRVTWLTRWTARREAFSREARAVVVTVVFILLEVFWRLAPVVDDVAAHGWGRALESVTLVGAGVALFVSMVESPPLTPLPKRVLRIFMAAPVMWTIWIIGYMDGMTGAGWYRVFHHVAGAGVSLVADKEIATGVLWATSAVIFIPVVFWNMVHWLQSESTPDEEMYDLVREERTRGLFGPRAERF